MEVNSVYLDLETYSELLVKANLYDKIKENINKPTDIKVISKADMEILSKSIKEI
ncbi:hypothetical protein [Staphylococcus xylosus]|uniref:hypothetical protein n=1 Tax=Staphylococcus xylosus TaxID=1288 RepID=UPI001304B280|nr:hypothetical protein [Staphylococcus xylosus]